MKKLVLAVVVSIGFSMTAEHADAFGHRHPRRSCGYGAPVGYVAPVRAYRSVGYSAYRPAYYGARRPAVSIGIGSPYRGPGYYGSGYRGLGGYGVGSYGYRGYGLGYSGFGFGW